MSALPPASPTPHDEVSGEALNDILPNYDVLDLLGRGGMGVVYKARQVSLDRIVAIKLLPREILRDDLDFKERFKQEARTMARLSHAGIVAVHDFGETEDGQLFFAMEFIEGTDLAKLIEQCGALPVDEALRLFRAVAEALMYAHGEGVIHRDIKPANVLIKENGEVKVADFGLAKIVTPGTVGLTATSTSMGSHDFAAPEIFVHGGDADHRADIYSLGVMLYQMLTGTIPRGMFKLPSERVPGLDTRVDEVICKAMEQDREDRYQSVSEMLEAMIFAPRSESASPSLVRDNANEGGATPLRWASIAAALVVLLGSSAWFARRDATPPSMALTKLTSSEWQDVLAKMDVTQHRRSGKWRMVNGQFENVNDAAVHGAVLEIPVSPAGSFDLKVKLMRLPPGAGTVYFPFRFRDHAGVFAMTEYGMPRVGLEMIDGKSRSTNGAHAEHVAAYLPLNQSHDVQLCVRDEGIVVLLDDQEIYRWKGDWSRVTQEGTWVPENLGGRKVFAICAGSLSVRLQSVALREVPGEAGKTLPLEPAPNVPRTPPLPAPVVFAKNGHRYQFVPGQFTWTDAEKNAKSMGGHLATLTTQEEHDFLWEQFSPWLPSQQSSRIRNRGWWIGGSLTGGKEWQWITSEPFEFQRLDKTMPLDARVPRLLQCDNEGGGMMSSWRTMHYSLRFGYLVEWDDPMPTVTADAETRQLVAWLLSLPLSHEPSHEEHKVPDVLVEGSTRNLRKVSELPVTPFSLSRIRIGPLPMDDITRQHLHLLSRQTRLYDLRIYAAEDAEVLSSVRPLTRLGTFVFKAMPSKTRQLTDARLASVADLVNLNSLRIEGWSSLTGSGLSAFKNKRKLSSLSINDCPDLDDTGLAEIAKFTGLETLSLLGAIKLTDAGLLQLKSLKQLKSLGLGIRTKFSDKTLAELKLALPQCVVNVGE